MTGLSNGSGAQSNGSRLLETRLGRLLVFSLLYLSEGIPWGFSAIALVTYLRRQGVGVGEIGA